MLMLRQVTAGMKGQDKQKEKEKCERSGGSVWVMKQVTVRMEGQDGLTQREEDEWSEVCVCG